MSDAPDDESTDAGGERPESATADAGEERPESATADAGDDRTRRWLIRALVGLGVGVPVAVEGATFLGLVGKHLGDGSGTATRSATPAGRRVGVGDELLPDTPQREVLSDAAVKGGSGDTWSFDVLVTVRNTGEAPYEVRLGAVTTDGGRTVTGGASSGAVESGATATLTESWTVPAGSQPSKLVVYGITHGETATRVRETVRLARVPIEG
jgi:hypothetical protein